MKITIPGKEKIGENLLYLLLWSAIFLVPLLNAALISQQHIFFKTVLVAWYKIAPYFVVFLIHNIVIAPRMIRHRVNMRYLFANIGVAVVIFFIVDFLNRHITITMPAVDPLGHEFETKATLSDLTIFWNVVCSMFMVMANMGIKLIYKSIRDEQVMEQLKRENLQVEMDYLKYQINPHFFMNTLNNIHALIDIDTDSAKSALIDLSKMMRYVLYDSGREATTLAKDIAFIENYIELMRIRYANTIDIKIDYSEQERLGEISIPPLLLIVFIENAFKHGFRNKQDAFIHLKAELAADGDLVCTIANSTNKHNATSAENQGIGLKNVRKRLELIYNSNFALEITDNEGVYIVKLKIPTTYA